ncbi:MAG TPA: hypothetical protein VMS17_14405 [Gemmataceae bacterium]|nr:hypothetical protein [Gemmataceae bacterium]
MNSLILLVAAAGAPPCEQPDACGSYLCQPAFCVDDVLRGPTEPYCPQPGDIFLASDGALWSKVGHWWVGSQGVQHSGIMFLRPDGRMALLQAGPFNSVKIECLDPVAHLREHCEKGDRVWIRRRCTPLTPEQSAALTAFAEKQEGKRFATWRMLAQATKLCTRGPLRTYFLGKVHGPDRVSYWCSEMVMESCVYAGLRDAEDTRPTATYPRDLFFGHSKIPFLDEHLRLDDWHPPARWTPERLP